MSRSFSRGTALGMLLGALAAPAPTLAVPIPKDTKADIIADRAGFIPYRKHLAVPGKIVAALVADAQSILTTEGRFGPADQLCLGWNGGSYRWVYVPAGNNSQMTNLSIALPEGKTKIYPKLNMASPTTLKPAGIDVPYALVEVEVNDGAGSPVNDSFVATRVKKLDGSKEYPIQVAAAIAGFRKQYDAYLSDKQKDLDAAMDDTARKAIKEQTPTGPRVKNTLMFVTWLAETEKLQVRFLTRITDGGYKYDNGIKIELRLPALPPAPPQGGALPPPRLENGLRYGMQFGIEVGAQFEISKAGKIAPVKALELRAFQKELPAPLRRR